MPTPPSGTSPTAPVSAFAPLAVPAYRRVWSAAVVSHMGTFLQLTAAPWLMRELTGSPLLVALVTTALTLPRLLLTLPAGVLADVLDRRTLMVTGQLVSAVSVAAMAVLTWLDVMTPTALLALTFGLGVGSAIALPAFQTLVPDLVDQPLRAQAITLNSAAFNVARAVGPSIGGALVAAGLAGAAFGANAASYLGIVGVLLTLPRQTVEDPSRQPMWRSAALGMRYVRFTRPIRVLVAVTGGFALTAVSVQALLPNVVADDLGLGASGYGLLFGVFGAGALVGAFTRERGRARLGALMLPAALTGFGLAGVVFGLSRLPALSAVALAAAGLTWVWTLTTLNATIQIMAPRWVRNRVVSLYILAMGLQPIGALLSGALAEVTGAGVSVAVTCGFTVVLGLVAFRLGLPVLGEVAEPVPTDVEMPRHARRVAGTPVIVATTWEIDPEEVDEFLDVMRTVRRERLRTGAHRWSLYRDADRPYRITEFFVLHDWDEHLAQHARMDAEAAEVIRRARAFDRADGPVTRHLAGLDVVDPGAAPFEEQLLTEHEEAHRTDGSIPLEAHGPAPHLTDGP